MNEQATIPATAQLGVTVREDFRPSLEYHAFLDAGKFMLLRDRDSGRVFFYPRVATPGTGSQRLEWIEASGKGTVYAVTVISQRPPAPSYNVVLVDLAEGPRLMSRVKDAPPDSIVVGMPVTASIEQIDGHGVLLFVPSASRSGQ